MHHRWSETLGRSRVRLLLPKAGTICTYCIILSYSSVTCSVPGMLLGEMALRTALKIIPHLAMALKQKNKWRCATIELGTYASGGCSFEQCVINCNV